MKNLFTSNYFYLALILILLPVQIFLGIYLYFSAEIPSPEEVSEVDLQIPLKIYTADGKLIGEYGEIHRTKLEFNEIPEIFVQAFLAAEDSDYFTHTGVDLFSLIRATYQFLREGEIVSGGGTITMQVARNYVLTKDRTFERKLKEIFAAFKIDFYFTKEEIFELYVNQIFLGNRAYGIAAAADIYYGKALSDLSLPQVAMIAGLPKAPSKINPLINPRKALNRRNWVLGRMRDLNYINEEDFFKARNTPITASFTGVTPEVDADYLAEEIRQYIINEYGLNSYKEGYQVVSTINSNFQASARKAVEKGIEEYERRHGFEKPENYQALIPDLFKNRSDFFYSFFYDPNEFLDEFGIELDTKNPFSNVMRFLERLSKFKNLNPSLILSVKKDTLVLIDELGKIQKIYLSKLKYPIRPKINENRKDKKLTDFKDFFNLGDLIWASNPNEIEQSIALHPKVQSALVSIDPSNGDVLAMVGGYNFNASQFNRATQAKPQLGSTFKPFLYAAAFENGFNPASVINDAPIVFEDKNLEDVWRPKNSGGIFYGPTRLREALVQSRNVVSVRLLQELSIEVVKDSLERYGFDKGELPSDLSLALGSYGMSPLNNAKLFSVFANGGKRVSPFFIKKIILPNKEEIIFKEDTEPSKGIYLSKWYGYKAKIDNDFEVDPRVSFILNDILKEAANRGTGRKIRSLNRKDFAGKTGTSNDAESTWFTGFNPEILTTVWFGYDNPKGLGDQEFGSTTSLPIWLDYMSTIVDEIPYKNLKKPSGLIARKINKKTGNLATTEDKDVKFEYFLN
tara:strand:- start:1087 stop:3477 length:2391 start_codon:yes stop_codon:yes gene_type:complete